MAPSTSSHDFNFTFIILILFLSLISSHPLADSKSMSRNDSMLPTTTNSNQISTHSYDASSSFNSSNSSMLLDAAYMARVYGRIGVNYDIDAGRPFIYCEKFNPKSCEPSKAQCPSLEQCYAELHSLDERLGCMTVFKYVPKIFDGDESGIEVTLKGCWQHDKEAIADCKAEDECVAESHRRPLRPKMEFCCCRSHMCNKKVSIRVLNEEESVVSAISTNTTSEINSMSNLMDSMWYAILFAIIGICTVSSLFLFSVIYRRYWHTSEKGKNQAVTNSQQSETYTLLNWTESRPTFEVTDMKHVASGRFGEVFSAIYRCSDIVEQVAVKILKDKESWQNEQNMYIDVLRRSAHPNIVRYVDAEQYNNEYWIITEFMNGGNLHDYLVKNVLSLKQCLHIMSGMLEGLAFLHEAQGNKFTVVHRDIKSKNILLKSVETKSPENELRLTACIADFGLAAVFSSPKIDDHVIGQVGTFRYMSPEVLEGATEFTIPAFQRIDVYAMALVMWEVISRTSFGVDDVNTPVYKQPFEDMTNPYPSLGEMRDVVVNRKLRPEFRSLITRHRVGSEIESTIRDMWHTIADGRITASRARERINTLVDFN